MNQQVYNIYIQHLYKMYWQMLWLQYLQTLTQNQQTSTEPNPSSVISPLSSELGGTASRLSGGKFANGAITGAFSRLFNDEKHKMMRELRQRQEDEAMSGGFSPLPADFETKWGDSISLTMMSDFELYSESGAQYQFDSAGLVYQPSASGRVDSVAPESYLIGTRWSGRFLDIFTGGYGVTIGKTSFLYQMPKIQGRMIFKHGKFRFQYSKIRNRVLQPWYKRTYLKLPGKTNKHWPWD